jgi:hypothetical protein
MEVLRQVYSSTNGLLGVLVGNPGSFYTAIEPTQPTDFNAIIINNTGATGSTMNLEYADATHPGIDDTTGQQFGGFKQFQQITAPFANASNNVAFTPLMLNIPGTSNTIFGESFLNIGPASNANTAFGSNVLDGLNVFNNTTKTSAYGFGSISNSPVGTSCSAFGCQTLLLSQIQCDGFGTFALFSNDTSPNTGFGAFVLNANTFGLNNVGFGQAACKRLNAGSNNTAIGSNSGSFSLFGNNNTFIGFNSGINYVNVESNNILINNLGVVGENNVIRIGITQTGNYQAGIYDQTTSQTSGIQVFVSGDGQLATYTPNMVTYENMVLGYQAGTSILNSTGTSNSIFGAAAAPTLVGSQNVIMGAEAGFALTEGSNNTIIGDNAGGNPDFTTSNNNILVGVFSGFSFNNNESNNIIIGDIGIPNDQEVIRIGTTSGTGAQMSNYQAGISGVNLGTGHYVSVLANGQLGLLGSPTGAFMAGSPTGAIDQNGILINNVSKIINLEFADNMFNGIVSATGQEFTGFKQFSAITAPFINGSNNVLFGTNALSSITSGTGNSALGKDALEENLSGSNNVAIGSEALGANQPGNNNTAIGSRSLFQNIFNTSNNNTAIGSSSASANTSGFNNVVIGSALQSNQNGSSSTAVGYLALNNDISSGQNTAVGSNCLTTNTVGQFNTGIGANALAFNDDGSSNIAAGDAALIHATSSFNIAIGVNTLSGDADNDNIAIGFEALNLCTGAANIGVGFDTLSGLENGNDNIAIGNTALNNLVDGDSNIAIGSQAGSNYTGSETNNIIIGNSGVSGENSIIRIGTVGSHTGNFQAGIFNVPLGVGSFVGVTEDGQLGTLGGLGLVITAPTGPVDSNGIIINNTNNTITMEYASSTLPGIVSTTGQQFGGFKQFSAITAPFVDGSNNVLYGAGALSSITSGTGNTAVGYNALGLNTTGSNNIAFGVQALSNNIGGSNNIALGDETLRSNINGNNNVGIGASSLSGNIGNNNLGIGMNAGFDLTNGDNNIIIGTNVSGTGAQADSIQIGAQGTQTSCAIAGIAGTIITNASPVLINITTGQLGSIVSAKKYKENIKNITTTDLLKLRPVTFTYIGDEKLKKQVGLIAE